jgi:methyl acetate hydrolase
MPACALDDTRADDDGGWGMKPGISRRQAVKTAGLITAAAPIIASPILASRSVFAATEGPPHENQPALPGIDTAFRNAIGAAHIPGVVAMAAAGDDILYEGVFGSRHLGEGQAMSRDTVFRVASMVKVITSVAAMQLVEQDRIKLDEPVPGIDPLLAAPQVLAGYDAAGAPEVRPASGPITLRHLLTHTAGFTYRLWDAQALHYQHACGTLPARKRTALPHLPLMFEPGTRWQYGTSIDWVGKIVETVSGERLDVYFRKNILGPLGMVDTGFTLTPAQRTREASAHRRKPDGALVAEPLEKPSNPTHFSGGGSIYSTAPDYLTLARALMNGGRGNGVAILKPETVALMGENQIGDIPAGIMKTTNPALSNDVDFFPGVALRWGLGHMINLTPGPNGRSAGSMTWAGLLNTYYWIDPQKRVAAVFMSQVLPFADKPALTLYRRFERGVYDAVKAA